MTRSDSAASLLALRAGAGTRARASASTSTGTVASAAIAAIGARTAIAARVAGILGPLGIQRQVGRHRRTKDIRLRARLIGIPTAEGITLTSRIGRLGQLAIGRSLEIDLGALTSLKRDLNATVQLEQRAGIVDVVKVALGIACNWRVAVVVVPRCVIHARSLRIAHLVAIHTATRGVVNIIGGRTVVDGEINVRAICLGTHERSTLNTASRKRDAVGRGNQRRSKVVGKIDNRQRRSARNLATDNQLVAIQRGHAGTSRKPQIDNALFGNVRRGLCLCARQRQHVKLAVTRNYIGMFAIFGQHAGGVDKGPERNASEHIARRLAEHLHSTSARGNQNKTVAHRGARPVITLVGVDVLPRNSAGQDIDARQMAVVVSVRSVIDINGANIEIVTINRQLRI